MSTNIFTVSKFKNTLTYTERRKIHAIWNLICMKLIGKMKLIIQCSHKPIFNHQHWYNLKSIHSNMEYSIKTLLIIQTRRSCHHSYRRRPRQRSLMPYCCHSVQNLGQTQRNVWRSNQTDSCFSFVSRTTTNWGVVVVCRRHHRRLELLEALSLFL